MLGGAWRVGLGTLWGTLGGKGVTWEPDVLPKWVPPMPVRHLGTILELPGSIRGANLVSFWCLFGHLFVKFSVAFFIAFFVVSGTTFGSKMDPQRSGFVEKRRSGNENDTLEFEQPFHRFP